MPFTCPGNSQNFCILCNTFSDHFQTAFRASISAKMVWKRFECFRPFSDRAQNVYYNTTIKFTNRFLKLQELRTRYEHFFVESGASPPQQSCILWDGRGLAAVAVIAQKRRSFLPNRLKLNFLLCSSSSSSKSTIDGSVRNPYIW